MSTPANTDFHVSDGEAIDHRRNVRTAGSTRLDHIRAGHKKRVGSRSRMRVIRSGPARAETAAKTVPVSQRAVAGVAPERSANEYHCKKLRPVRLPDQWRVLVHPLHAWKRSSITRPCPESRTPVAPPARCPLLARKPARPARRLAAWPTRDQQRPETGGKTQGESGPAEWRELPIGRQTACSEALRGSVGPGVAAPVVLSISSASTRCGHAEGREETRQSRRAGAGRPGHRGPGAAIRAPRSVRRDPFAADVYDAAVRLVRPDRVRQACGAVLVRRISSRDVSRHRFSSSWKATAPWG